MALTLRRFNLDDYQRMIQAGILTERDRVELLDGEIIEMPSMGDEHIFGVLGFTNRLVLNYHAEALVLVQCPVQLPPDSEPEPDLALLKPPEDRYKGRKPHPEDVLLIIEISDTTLNYDKGKKLDAYARAMIPEVWIRNLSDNLLEVFRHPDKGKYRTHLTYLPGEDVTPLFSSKPFKWS
jgi:Uma2 family endonuclease